MDKKREMEAKRKKDASVSVAYSNMFGGNLGYPGYPNNPQVYPQNAFLQPNPLPGLIPQTIQQGYPPVYQQQFGTLSQSSIHYGLLNDISTFSDTYAKNGKRLEETEKATNLPKIRSLIDLCQQFQSNKMEQDFQTFMGILVKATIPLSLLRLQYPDDNTISTTYKSVVDYPWMNFNSMKFPTPEQVKADISSRIIQHRLYQHVQINLNCQQTNFEHFSRAHQSIALLEEVHTSSKLTSVSNPTDPTEFIEFCKNIATQIVKWIQSIQTYQFLNKFTGTDTANEQEKRLKVSLTGLDQFVKIGLGHTTSIYPDLFISIAKTIPPWNVVHRDKLEQRKNILRFLEILVRQMCHQKPIHRVIRDRLEDDPKLSLDPDLFNIIDGAIQGRPQSKYHELKIEDKIDFRHIKNTPRQNAPPPPAAGPVPVQPKITQIPQNAATSQTLPPSANKQPDPPISDGTASMNPETLEKTILQTTSNDINLVNAANADLLSYFSAHTTESIATILELFQKTSHDYVSQYLSTIVESRLRHFSGRSNSTDFFEADTFPRFFKIFLEQLQSEIPGLLTDIFQWPMHQNPLIRAHSFIIIQQLLNNYPKKFRSYLESLCQIIQFGLDDEILPKINYNALCCLLVMIQNFETDVPMFQKLIPSILQAITRALSKDDQRHTSDMMSVLTCICNKSHKFFSENRLSILNSLDLVVSNPLVTSHTEISNETSTKHQYTHLLRLRSLEFMVELGKPEFRGSAEASDDPCLSPEMITQIFRIILQFSFEFIAADPENWENRTEEDDPNEILSDSLNYIVEYIHRVGWKCMTNFLFPLIGNLLNDPDVLWRQQYVALLALSSTLKKLPKATDPAIISSVFELVSPIFTLYSKWKPEGTPDSSAESHRRHRLVWGALRVLTSAVHWFEGRVAGQFTETLISIFTNCLQHPLSCAVVRLEALKGITNWVRTVPQQILFEKMESLLSFLVNIVIHRGTLFDGVYLSLSAMRTIRLVSSKMDQTFSPLAVRLIDSFLNIIKTEDNTDESFWEFQAVTLDAINSLVNFVQPDERQIVDVLIDALHKFSTIVTNSHVPSFNISSTRILMDSRPNVIEYTWKVIAELVPERFVAEQSGILEQYYIIARQTPPIFDSSMTTSEEEANRLKVAAHDAQRKRESAINTLEMFASALGRHFHPFVNDCWTMSLEILQSVTYPLSNNTRNTLHALSPLLTSLQNDLCLHLQFLAGENTSSLVTTPIEEIIQQGNTLNPVSIALYFYEFTAMFFRSAEDESHLFVDLLDCLITLFEALKPFVGRIRHFPPESPRRTEPLFDGDPIAQFIGSVIHRTIQTKHVKLAEEISQCLNDEDYDDDERKSFVEDLWEETSVLQEDEVLQKIASVNEMCFALLGPHYFSSFETHILNLTMFLVSSVPTAFTDNERTWFSVPTQPDRDTGVFILFDALFYGGEYALSSATRLIPILLHLANGHVAHWKAFEDHLKDHAVDISLTEGQRHKSQTHLHDEALQEQANIQRLNTYKHLLSLSPLTDQPSHAPLPLSLLIEHSDMAPLRNIITIFSNLIRQDTAWIQLQLSQSPQDNVVVIASAVQPLFSCLVRYQPAIQQLQPSDSTNFFTKLPETQLLIPRSIVAPHLCDMMVLAKVISRLRIDCQSQQFYSALDELSSSAADCVVSGIKWVEVLISLMTNLRQLSEAEYQALLTPELAPIVPSVALQTILMALYQFLKVLKIIWVSLLPFRDRDGSADLYHQYFLAIRRFDVTIAGMGTGDEVGRHVLAILFPQDQPHQIDDPALHQKVSQALQRLVRMVFQIIGTDYTHAETNALMLQMVKPLLSQFPQDLLMNIISKLDKTQQETVKTLFFS
ncbi:hypothetical protein BLNAU_13097 [Blattamonas nauphoetae]|uniref:IPO4/5-like TPR repeats domain-containing protein n=1 Tax=Blattamonas nauphoetae TaxID=2049346 RepID=A0ABQ9XHT0_9EUKA|nr:hypothetical protein BLNAU_13097 [Blattamonas nauphoetae]